MFFKKKKQPPLYHTVDDKRTVVHDFRLRSTRIGFESYRVRDYRLYPKLKEEEMLPLLEDHLSRLFSGEVDAGNGNMLDALIFGAAREAWPDLKRQHIDHRDILRRLITRNATDTEDIRRIKQQREAEYAVMQSDYDRTCAMIEKTEEGLR